MYLPPVAQLTVAPLAQQTLATEPPTSPEVAQTETPRVPSYLGWAAALTALCWPAFPAGVTALVYAGRAEALAAAGDSLGARASSARAKTWCWVTFWAGATLWLIALTLIVTL